MTKNVNVDKTEIKNNIEVLLNKGINLYESEEYLQALTIFGKIIEIDPNWSNLDFWETRAKSLSKLKKYKESIECFYKVLEVEADIDYLYDILLEEANELYEIEQYNRPLA